MHNILDHGASTDGRSLCTAAFASAIAAARQAGGGTVYVPPGRYCTGSIQMRSDIHLDLDAGAVVLGSTDPVDFPLVSTRWEGSDVTSHAGLIHGVGLKNIAITGHGTIDGQGHAWWPRARDKTLEHPRPRLINFYRCSGVRLEGVTLRNSPAWTVNPVDCDDVVIDRLTVRNPADSPNTDGINPESCRNVRITNCLVDVGDDCITIKAGVRGGAERRPCRNVIVSNCTLVNGHGGVVIGSEMSGGVRDVVISNCVFEGTDRGIRIKTRRGRGGVVENVRVSNLIMRRVWAAVTINMYYRCGTRPDEAGHVEDTGPRAFDQLTPMIRNIHLTGVTATDIQGQAGVFLLGLPESPIANVTLDDVIFETSAGPGDRPELPVMIAGALPDTRGEFYARNVTGLSLSRVRLPGRSSLGLHVSGAADVRLSEVTTPDLDDGGPGVLLHDVTNARLGDVMAAGSGRPARVQQTRATPIGTPA